MDTKNMNTFLQVADLRSFTKAAEKLGYTQSTVSFQIKQLETELGVTLFDRINHTITLTEDGHRLLRTVHQINQLIREYQHESVEPGELQGHVRLAMASSLCTTLMGSIFPKLHAKYPGITLEIISGGTESMFRMLDQNEVDLVYTLDSHIYNTNYLILTERQIRTHFVCSTSHPLARAQVKVTDLMTEPFILTEKNMSYRKVLDEKLAARSLEIMPILESGSTKLITDLVNQNLGISFLPDYSSWESLEKGLMTYIHVQDCSIDIWTQLLIHRDKWISQPIQIVIDFLKEATAEIL